MKTLFTVFSGALFAANVAATFAYATPVEKLRPDENWILRGPQKEMRRFARTRKLKVFPLFSPVEQKFLRRLGREQLASTQRLKLTGADEAGILRRLIVRQKLSLSLQPDFIVHSRPPLLKRKKSKASRVTPLINDQADPLAKEQWALNNTGLVHREFVDDFNSTYIQGVKGEDVHLPSVSKQGAQTIVAVLDTGVDLTHPDLKNQIAYKPRECAALEVYDKCLAEKSKRECADLAEVDTDGNGYPLDCAGWNMTGDEVSKKTGVVGNNEIKDPEDIAHGSHVAGIIAGESGNHVGIRGIAPKAKILPIRVINSAVGRGEGTIAEEDDATGLISTVARGMLFAIDSKANVINLSLGWDRRADSLVQAPVTNGEEPSGKSLMEETVEIARQAGVLVVGSAGNDSTDALVYPCQISGVLCVAAHSADGTLASFSNYGSGVDLAAPGHDILSSMPFDYAPEVFTDYRGFDFMDGTSMSAPYASGAAAVLMGEGYSADETFARLIAGARPAPKNRTKVTLSGNLDVSGALKVAPRPLIVPFVKGVTYGLWKPTDRSVHLKFRLKNLWAPTSGVSLRLSSADNEVLSSFYRVRQSSLVAGSWAKNEVKLFEIDLNVLDPRLSSDVNLQVEVRNASGAIANIRVPFIISTRVSKLGEHPNAVIVPVRSGKMLPDAKLYIVTARDGKPASDWLAIDDHEAEWKIQVVREEKDGYVFGDVRTVPAPKNGGIRSPERLDVNFDGVSDYVLPFAAEGERPKKGRTPVYFNFYFIGTDGKDVVPPFTYKNDKSQMDLEHLQWLRVGNRLLPAWIKGGTTPDEQKPAFTPWNPEPEDNPVIRVYYADPSLNGGVRSIAAPKGYFFEAAFEQSLDQRLRGEFYALASNSNNYMTEYFSFAVRAEGKIESPEPIQLPTYRNLRHLDTFRPLNLQGGNVHQLTLGGANGVTDQLITSLVGVPPNLRIIDQRVLPAEWTDVAYKVMGTYFDTARGPAEGLASFTQANYNFLYVDSSLREPLETSLRRYTFLSAAMFARLFYPTVTESHGLRLPALFIADSYGAYLGAEIITPIRDAAGKSIALARPASLRFLNLDGDCDWLVPRDATPTGPAEAVYFCGDRFVRIPYRF